MKKIISWPFSFSLPADERRPAGRNGPFFKGLPGSVMARPGMLISLIVMTCLAVYFNALFNGFVYDDGFQILKNRWITDIKYIPEIFSGNVWQFKGIVTSNYYRPLMHVTYLICHAVFGFKPWGFHLVNIMLHAGVSVLVFLIAARVLSQSDKPGPFFFSPAFVAAEIYAVHPIHTEAVAWVAGLPDVAFTFFSLLSFYLYMRSEGGTGLRYAASVLSFFCATLFKEPALTLPLILVAYDFAFRESTPRSRFWLSIKRYVPYFIVVGIYFLLRFHALGGFAPYRSHGELSTSQYIINIFPLFIQYLVKLVFPLNLNAYHVFHPATSIFEMKVMVPLFLSLLFLALFYVSARKNREAFLGLVFLVVPLLPVLYIPGLGDSVFTERYLYFPSVGFVLLLALLYSRLGAAKRSMTVPLTAAFALLLIFYSLGVVDRNAVWRDNYSLWADTVKKSPDAAIPHGDFGLALLSYPQRLDEAIEHLQIAIALGSQSNSITEKNNLATFFNNLGSAYSAKGWEDKAVEQYQMAIRVNPSYVNAYNNLGVSYLESGRVDEGIQLFQAALGLQPDLAETHNNLGLAYLRKGLADQAIEQLQEAVYLSPDDPYFYYGLADAYKMKGLYENAAEAIRRGKGLEGR
jgi:tetratricopeptide (TPR) repeat protein